MQTTLASFGIALGLSLLLTPLAAQLGRWGQAMDKPDGQRKIHAKPTPRTGGIALFGAFALTVLLIGTGNPRITELFGQRHGSWCVLAAGLIVFGTGLWDDYRRLGHRVKFASQIVAATIVFACGYHIEVFSLFGWQFHVIISYALTVFWFLIFINAVNLIDGLDGLAAGICFFCCMAMTLLTLVKDDHLAALLFATLGGSILGFLRYNFNPASIFMGDGGSYFLGFAIAMTSLSSSVKSQTSAAILIPVIALGVPMFDAILSPVRRFLVGKGLFKPDQGHIHHRIAKRLGLNTRRAVLLIYLITVILCVLALFVSNLQSDDAGILLILAGAAALIFIRKLGYSSYVTTEKFLGWLQDISDESGFTKDRRTFLNLQMNVAYSQGEEEFWQNTCAALHRLGFDYSEILLKHSPGDLHHSWYRNNFDASRDICRANLLKLELPLVSDDGVDFGMIWLVKDLNINPINHYTLRRVEHLRRTIVDTRRKMSHPVAPPDKKSLFLGKKPIPIPSSAD